ncbi:unnamed protein product [Brassica napus]|uniref:(rape) hypothetical protein n=1 Tax=Brassica napus TaxID=3708 RepID=A0A816KAK5_BRANA|nr:unnamed protein product [Brassica napus]
MRMATMLDEIINYVQSLQNQVEKTKAREAVEMGQGRVERSVFHSSSWTL